MVDSTACEVYTGVLPRFWWPSDVDAGKQKLAADLKTANVAADACTGLPPTMRAEWAAFYEAASTYAGQSTPWLNSGRSADELQSYQCALYKWQQQFVTSGCQIVAPTNPNPPQDTGVSTAIQWISIAAASIAGAFIVGKVAEVALVGMSVLPKKPKTRGKK